MKATPTVFNRQVSKKIAVVGLGYVGLAAAVSFAEYGHCVSCMDIDTEKIECLKKCSSPFYEPGLADLLRSNTSRLSYTSDIKDACINAEIIFLAVQTPELPDGSADLTYLYEAATNIRAVLKKTCILVVKSTVPVGTCDQLASLFDDDIEVVSNPEFLAQGRAVYDMLHPARIVIGTVNEPTRTCLHELYSPFGAPIVWMDRRTAELTKYACNDFLALKLSYINEIANLCERFETNIELVTEAMGLDSRIGHHFLKAGIGYGGSCFSKDTKALYRMANDYGYELRTVHSAIEVNEYQKKLLIHKIKKYYANLCGKRIAVLGLAFKPETDDLREAASIACLPFLMDAGATAVVYDPKCAENVQRLFPSVFIEKSSEDALIDADIALIFTEWREICNITPEVFIQRMRHPIILDGRNCYDIETMRNHKLIYDSVGRPVTGCLKINEKAEKKENE